VCVCAAVGAFFFGAGKQAGDKTDMAFQNSFFRFPFDNNKTARHNQSFFFLFFSPPLQITFS
jgi:hypothetical protein